MNMVTLKKFPRITEKVVTSYSHKTLLHFIIMMNVHKFFIGICEMVSNLIGGFLNEVPTFI
jgi:hypothetical protein